MKPDGTSSFSTADEKPVSLKGNCVPEPEKTAGSEVKKCADGNASSWSYLFVHHTKVKAMEAQLMKDKRVYFIHKTIRYFKKTGRHNVQRKEMPTVSGLVFFQGNTKEIQAYLDEYFPSYHLCKNCSTGQVAVIPDLQMQRFMCVNETEPERIRFLLKPFHYYARNRTLLRIVGGDLAGLEGYVIRIDRDRRLVMDVGGMSVAVAGVHAEHFEEVEPSDVKDMESGQYVKRNLQEREALIDRYFHPVKTAADVTLQAEHIDYLYKYVQAELAQNRMNIRGAWETYSFIVKEIGYYYADIFEDFKKELAPVMQQGSLIVQELEHICNSPNIDGGTRVRYQTAYQELLTKYGYLFLDCGILD